VSAVILPNLGIAYVAPFRKNGYEVDLIEGNALSLNCTDYDRLKALILNISIY
jgi:hypothetical protein